MQRGKKKTKWATVSPVGSRSKRCTYCRTFGVGKTVPGVPECWFSWACDSSHSPSSSSSWQAAQADQRKHLRGHEHTIDKKSNREQANEAINWFLESLWSSLTGYRHVSLWEYRQVISAYNWKWKGRNIRLAWKTLYNTLATGFIQCLHVPPLWCCEKDGRGISVLLWMSCISGGQCTALLPELWWNLSGDT